jgi:hypothetical protein
MARTKRSAVVFIILFALVACVAGAASLLTWRSNRQACPMARELADSLASNRTRLEAVDSVLARFDLEDRATVLDVDSTKGSSEPNRLERQIIVLRMQGVSAPQMDRWLRNDLHLSARADTSAATRAATRGQVVKIRAHETNPAYVNDMRTNYRVTSDPWHDMAALPRLSALWAARCAASAAGLRIALTALVAAAALLGLYLRRWFGARRRDHEPA